MTTGTSSIVQIRPDELADVLTADFQRRAEPQFAWKSCISQFLALPGLRGFWPMSSVYYTASPRVPDASGQGNDLDDNNTVTFGYDNLAPYAGFVAASSQYLDKADGGAANWADVIGTETYIVSAAQGLTLGGWFYVDTLQSGNIHFMSKFEAAANDRSYALYHNADSVYFSIYNSVNVPNSLLYASRITTDEWFFLVGRFERNTALTLWFNGGTATTVAGVLGDLFDSTADFTIGARSDGTLHLDGRASMCFLCATALSDAIISQLYEQSRIMFGVL